MKTLILSATLLTAVSGAWAAGKTDLGSRARIHAVKHGITLSKTPGEEKKFTSAPARAKSSAVEPDIHCFITLTDGAGTENLENLGVSIDAHRGRMVLASFPLSMLESVEALPEIKSIRTDRTLTPKMDRVRAVAGIDKIHSGLDLPRAFTGKGVVAGIVDGGIDPNHVNFKKPDGTSRISSFTFYRPTQSGSYVEQTFGADFIPEIDTETSTTFHGTHTLGIMAGSYKGEVSNAVINADGMTCDSEDIANPYYGIATEADLAVACGAANDYYVAMGIEAILNYAYDAGKPSVINLSLGSNLGPHDGTSTLCQYLDQVSDLDRVIFCIAAGNEGELPIALHKTFSADDTSLSTCLRPGVEVDGMQNLRYGQLYVYSDSEKQFDLQATVVNSSRGAVAMRMPMGATSGAMKYWVSSADYKESDDDVVSPQLGKWFTGYIGVGAEFDEYSGRYYGVIDYMLWDNTSGNPSGNYIIGLQVDGSDSQRVDIYGDGSYCDFSGYGLDGFSDGMTDGTISDIACGHNTISVGSFNTRSEWGAMDGYVYTYPLPLPEGEISRFSSYASLPDGRVLPEVCAPGATVISSTNEYYLLENGLDDSNRQAYTYIGDRGYSWQQCTGTSMATPVVSGAIALWLEANPDLTYTEVKEIIAETAVKDDAVLATEEQARWGAGKFDAYAGLRKVLGMSGIAGVNGERETLTVTPAGSKSIGVTLPGASVMDIRIYTTSGVMTLALTVNGNDATVDLGSLAAGIYIVNVNGIHTQKIVVR